MDDFLPDPDQPSIQETLFPLLNCFGCGPINRQGLRLRSFVVQDQTRARFRPWPEHDNGVGFLNGGIITTLLDCHGASAVFSEADRQGWKPEPGTGLSYVTSGIDVRFRRPTPLAGEVDLIAEVQEASAEEITVVSRIRAQGKDRAIGTAVWKRWLPRG